MTILPASHVITGMTHFAIPENVEGLIFDCDGTIADTMPLHYKAWQTALGPHAQFFPETVFYELAGMPSAQIVTLLNERHRCNMDVDAVSHYKEELFQQYLPEVTVIAPVAEIVKLYHGRLPMAVATGGTRRNCVRTLELLNLAQYFQAVVTADEVPHGKPDPDIFLEAARRLKIDPEKCLVFEDADLGVQAARSAGMAVIDIR